MVVSFRANLIELGRSACIRCFYELKVLNRSFFLLTWQIHFCKEFYRVEIYNSFFFWFHRLPTFFSFHARVGL